MYFEHQWRRTQDFVKEASLSPLPSLPGLHPMGVWGMYYPRKCLKFSMWFGAVWCILETNLFLVSTFTNNFFVSTGKATESWPPKYATDFDWLTAISLFKSSTELQCSKSHADMDSFWLYIEMWQFVRGYVTYATLMFNWFLSSLLA